jgi:2-phosphoglycerate kinase
VTQPRHTEPVPLGGPGNPPFSKGLMARALMAVGVPAVRAYETARLIDKDIRKRGADGVELGRVAEILVEVLGEVEGIEAMRRLTSYRELRELDLPIILLVGGATGTGKSTVATEAAYRLGITRVTSTDFVRQTMRAFFSRDFMPSIHYSSFEAGDAVEEEREGDPAIQGFHEQTRNVLVGVHAALDRALEEGWSMVLEGVHLVPGLIPVEPIDGALVAQCVLAIEDEETHASHFMIRDATSGGIRPVDKYLDRFDEIRRIQRHIVARARRNGVPVIENMNLEHAISSVMELVLSGAERLQKV